MNGKLRNQVRTEGRKRNQIDRRARPYRHQSRPFECPRSCRLGYAAPRLERSRRSGQRVAVPVRNKLNVNSLAYTAQCTNASKHHFSIVRIIQRTSARMAAVHTRAYRTVHAHCVPLSRVLSFHVRRCRQPACLDVRIRPGAADASDSAPLANTRVAANGPDLRCTQGICGVLLASAADEAARVSPPDAVGWIAAGVSVPFLDPTGAPALADGAPA